MHDMQGGFLNINLFTSSDIQVFACRLALMTVVQLAALGPSGHVASELSHRRRPDRTTCEVLIQHPGCYNPEYLCRGTRQRFE
jgi:hypothetical protein